MPGTFTEEDKKNLFQSLAAIEARQHNTNLAMVGLETEQKYVTKAVAKIEEKQDEQGKIITNIRVKAARDAGIISAVVGVGVIIKSYFPGGGQ